MVNVTLPNINVPAIDPKTGMVDPIWYRFFETIYNRTGGVNDGLDANLKAIDEAVEKLKLFFQLNSIQLLEKVDFTSSGAMQEVKAFQQYAAQSLSDINGLITGVQENLSTINIQQYKKIQSISRNLSVTAGDLKAYFIEEIDAAVGPGSAIVDQLNAVQAAVGNLSASGLLRMTAEVGPAGVQSRVAISAIGDDGHTKATSGMYLDVKDVGGVLKAFITLISDQFQIAKNDGTITLLLEPDGTLKVDRIQANSIGTVHLAPDAATTFRAFTSSITTPVDPSSGNTTQMNFTDVPINRIYYDDNTGNGHDIDPGSVAICMINTLILPNTSHNFWVAYGVEAYNGSSWVKIPPGRIYKMQYGYLTEPYHTWDIPTSVEFWGGIEANLMVLVGKGYTKVRAYIDGFCSDDSKHMKILDPFGFFVIQSNKQS